MAFTKKNDEAVSPVIGVILMVAITVILAAVIAAFVFGMAGNISKTKIVAITAQKIDGQTITIMNQGGQDAPSFYSANITLMGGKGTITGYPSPPAGPTSNGYMGGSPVAVGCVTTMKTGTAGGFSGKIEVTVIGTFNDGTQQVLLDTFV